MTTRSSASNVPRLTYSPTAWLRSHQTSSIQLFLYVEGKNNDRSYYERVLRSVIQPSGITVRYELSRNIPGLGEGKPALLKGFDAARRAKLLRNSFTGKKTALLFFVDKDVDDFLKCKKRSSGLSYTTHYCVENHIAKESNVGRAIALASSADPSVVCTAIGDNGSWLSNKAQNQKDWLALCLLARKYGLRVPNYGVNSSLINPSLTGPTDAALLASQKSLFQMKSGLSSASFDTAFSQMRSLVDMRFRAGRQDSIFKGKWYTPFFEEAASVIVGRSNFNETVFRHSIWSSLVAEVDSASSGSDSFRRTVKDALTWLA